MAVMFLAPREVAVHLAQAVRAKRLAANFSQQGLATRCRVSLGTIKKFESTGKISLESLLHIAAVLDALPEFMHLFKQKTVEEYPTLDALLADKPRQRGRK